VSTGGETAKRDGTGPVGSENPAVAITGLHKWFGEFRVLADINLEVARGERIVICGPSGSGKSTLLRCVNALEEFQRGEIVVDGLVLTKDVKRIDAIRRDVGMVFQHFNLFPHLTVLENCTLAPIVVRGTPKAQAEATAMALLARVKIPEQAAKYPNQLSGGQQQRVAVARALAGKPAILLADEPTGNLDSRNGEAVMDLLKELHVGGATICMVTHDERFAGHAERAVHLLDGQVVEDRLAA
jgi:general L-amino acid transport system ATP-binding protein